MRQMLKIWDLLCSAIYVSIGKLYSLFLNATSSDDVNFLVDIYKFLNGRRLQIVYEKKNF